jgi:hypothetical protein
LKAELLAIPPPYSTAACHKVGWIQKDSCMQWFKHSVLVVKPSKKNPIFLTMVSHYSYSMNIEMIDCARENWLQTVYLPRPSTHTLQPMGVSFVQLLKTYHAREIEIWPKNHPNRVPTRYPITGLVGRAYLKSATAAITANRFRKTGLFP